MLKILQSIEDHVMHLVREAEAGVKLEASHMYSMLSRVRDFKDEIVASLTATDPSAQAAAPAPAPSSAPAADTAPAADASTPTTAPTPVVDGAQAPVIEAPAA